MARSAADWTTSGDAVWSLRRRPIEGLLPSLWSHEMRATKYQYVQPECDAFIIIIMVVVVVMSKCLAMVVSAYFHQYKQVNVLISCTSSHHVTKNISTEERAPVT